MASHALEKSLAWGTTTSRLGSACHENSRDFKRELPVVADPWNAGSAALECTMRPLSPPTMGNTGLALFVYAYAGRTAKIRRPIRCSLLCCTSGQF